MGTKELLTRMCNSKPVLCSAVVDSHKEDKSGEWDCMTVKSALELDKKLPAPPY